MVDETKGKRTYTVLRLDPIPTVSDLASSAGTRWLSEGEFDASSDRQAMHDGDLQEGEFVAIPRFKAHTVKPVQQTRLEWS